MAIYEIETDDITTIHQAIAARAGTDAMPRSNAMGADRMFLDYEVISPRITAEEAAARRSGKCVVDARTEPTAALMHTSAAIRLMGASLSLYHPSTR